VATADGSGEPIQRFCRTRPHAVIVGSARVGRARRRSGDLALMSTGRFPVIA
jgi:hypothetical protein